MLSERESLIGQLERGIVVIKLQGKKKPEKTILSLRRETMLIVWYHKGQSRNNFDGCVDIRDIQEVRLGSQKSRDLERINEDFALHHFRRCFILFYGREFNLKTISFVSISDVETQLWVKGLKYLMEEVRTASYRLIQERWFRKNFYEIENPNKEGSLGLSELKKFLQKVSYKITAAHLKEKYFAKHDSGNSGEISFDDFCSILSELLLHRDLFKLLFNSYSSDGKRVTLREFQQFLKEKQNSIFTTGQVADKMRNFLQDSSRNVQEPFFTIAEFFDWLFSKENHIIPLETQGIVNQDMNKPLSHYWISSSHNTYLTGDQISSESSVEAYARCLRMGCRSVELDCWDGPEDSPVIYHGHTLTSKIKFLDVIKVIKDHAFVSSEYPVILSIEDHCTLAQQRKMASIFEMVFGDMLVVAPLETNEVALPSPEKLKRKILLKHKKLPEGADEILVSEESIRKYDGGIDIKDSVRNGILFLQESENDDWSSNFFILTKNKMFYMDVQRQKEDEDEDEEKGRERNGDRGEEKCSSSSSSTTNDESVSEPKDSAELHFSESWFHRNLKSGRKSAENLLKEHSALGDGTFLVRPSETFIGDYSLSFLRSNEVYHVPIKSRQGTNGKVRYYLIDKCYFDSLFSLIIYYQKNPLRSAKFSITLTKAVPPPNQHIGKSWFHGSFNRETTERYLSGYKCDGAFIVRVGERVPDTYVISFRAQNKIKHCLIKPEGRLFSIGSKTFESLIELIAYYQKNPLYKNVLLKVTERPNDVIGFEREDLLSSLEYYDPESLTSETLSVMALYDSKALRSDELDLIKNCIITNVKMVDGNWWRGDLGDKKQHWFPSHLVTRLPSVEENSNSSFCEAPLGSSQKGSWNISGAKVSLSSSNPQSVNRNEFLLWIIKIQTSQEHTPKEYFVGALTREDACDWIAKIREISTFASVREDEHRKNERAMRVARELSNLVVYCRSVVFNLEYYLGRKDRIPAEMSSFPESKAEKIMSAHSQMMLWYHGIQISRVYPKAQRVDSSNYNPLPFWATGSQMAALNYQTGDKYMQINVGKFLQNGNCGYVLRPEYMMSPDYVPSDPSTLRNVEALSLGLRILGARHLTRPKNGILSPNVEIEILGADYDNFKNRTKTIHDNGFNPVWDEFFDFTIKNPELALLRFVVYDLDIFGENNFIGQFTCPLSVISPGFRSIPLKNSYSEELELSTLLVHVTLSKVSGESFELRTLKESTRELQRASLLSQELGDELMAESLRLEAQKKEKDVMRLLESVGR